MKKILLSLFLFMGMNSIAYSKNLNLGIAGSLQIPIGKFRKKNGIGGGGSAQIAYRSHGHLSLYLRSGYAQWSEKKILIAKSKFSIISTMVGVKYHFLNFFEKNNLYLNLDSGLSVINQTIKDIETLPDETKSKMRIGSTLGVGYQIQSFDINVSFNAFDMSRPLEVLSVSLGIGYFFDI